MRFVRTRWKTRASEKVLSEDRTALAITCGKSNSKPYLSISVCTEHTEGVSSETYTLRLDEDEITRLVQRIRDSGFFSTLC